MIKNILLSSILLGFFGITTSAKTTEYKHYKITDEGVFYLSGKDEPLLLPYANPKTFVVLDDEVAKDDRSVYVKNSRMFGIDNNSFTKIKPRYFQDNQYVYRLLLNDLSIVTKINSDYELYQFDDYWRQDNTVYLSSMWIENIDLQSFTLITRNYAKDKYHVYYDANPIEGMNVENFQIINSDVGLSKDKNAIFYRSKKIIDADVDSFELIHGYYFKDKNSIYFRDKKLENVDINSFEIFADNPKKSFWDNDYIAKDANFVFMAENIIPNADPDTFQRLVGRYSKDKNNVYEDKDIIEGANIESFEVLNYGDNKVSYYAKDKNNIYYGKKIIQNAMIENPIDIKTFKFIASRTAQDKNNVYYIYDDSVIPVLEADSASFELVNDKYARDKNNVYQIVEFIDKPTIYNSKVDVNTFKTLDNHYYLKDKYSVYRQEKEIQGSDPTTFKTLNREYSFDHKNVYFEHLSIKNADPKTFKILNDKFYISQDNKNIFHQEKIIKGSDAKSFTVLNDHFGKDNKTVYAFLKYEKQSEILKKADPKTFEVINRATPEVIHYAKDQKYVFYQNGYESGIVKGADPKTFETIGRGTGQDKNGCYKADKKVDCK